ncbi:MAG: hypothetical protein FWB76_03645 [Oscillospiraceae bacterium]|nr:hypothetical protein [Oscillospiraceae bacterium]
MQRKKPSIAPVVLFAILSFVMLATTVVTIIVGFEEATEENTTELTATVMSVHVIGEEPDRAIVIYSVEHGNRLRAPYNTSDYNHLSNAETVFFRVENIRLEQLERMPIIPRMSIRTEDVEIISLSSVNENNAALHTAAMTTGIIFSSISLLLAIFFGIRRKRSAAPQHQATQANTATKSRGGASSMIYMFRRTKFLYLGLVLLAALVSITLALAIEAVHPLLAFLVWIVLVLVSAAIAERYAGKLHNEILNTLAQKCDPHGFIEKHEKILTRKIGNMRTNILLNVSTGYLTSGDPQTAKHVLDSIQNFSNNSAGIISQVTYYNNLCSYYLNIDDIATAEVMHNHMLEVLKSEIFPKQQYDSSYNFYTEKQFSINIEKGDYSGAEEWFLIQFNREKSLLGKVSAQYCLGQIYLHFERFEEAAKAFDYVIEHGNTTYYVAKSRELLHQCTAKEE